MPRKRTKNKTRLANRWSVGIAWISNGRTITLAWRGAVGLTVIVLVAAFLLGMVRVHDHVEQIVRQRGKPRLTFVDIPPVIEELGLGELRSILENELRISPWTDAELVRRMSERSADCGWVAKVLSIRRHPSGEFVVRCVYRRPTALVENDHGYLLVDRVGIRLPGWYSNDLRWMIIQGVQTPAPLPGKPWMGEDLPAGLNLVEILKSQPYSSQITGINVANFDGRVDTRLCHILLKTDRTGGCVCWGSAPGREIEENSIAEKLEILQANYLQTGRVDAHFPTIDVSTRPHEFRVPIHGG